MSDFSVPGILPCQSIEALIADLAQTLSSTDAAAIEASGLGREGYRERFGSPDDNLHSMLEDALSTVAQRAARREALQNAFKASGKTVAEFAEMYGLDPAEAKRLLA